MESKELTQRQKKNRISKYFDEHFASEETEILDDLRMEKEPSLRFQTRSRIVMLYVAEGTVQEDFRMRRGAGTKEAYLLKQEAYIALNTYLAIHYKDHPVRTNSFEDSVIKVATPDEIVSLLYDAKKKTVYEKTRKRRKTQTKDVPVAKESVMEESPAPKKENVRQRKQEAVREPVEQIAEEVPIPLAPRRRHRALEPGRIIHVRYSDTEFTVIADMDNVVLARDAHVNICEIAKSDLEDI